MITELELKAKLEELKCLATHPVSCDEDIIRCLTELEELIKSLTIKNKKNGN